MTKKEEEQQQQQNPLIGLANLVKSLSERNEKLEERIRKMENDIKIHAYELNAVCQDYDDIVKRLEALEAR